MISKLKQTDILDKAFHNAWATLVQDPSQKAIPELFESQKMRLYFIEIYKCLYSKSGGDEGVMTHWFNTRNKNFESTPADICQTETGLLAIKKYFEAELIKN